ncbi:Homeobox protein Hox-D11 [Frankliniella fusca]|uniref:Homeobox protein Hox-D11 n=1 Tax=Frankliniella fusca TaxID=407009 RepID=A0AAE1I4L7_9NEOP|nr:Homeobox protein Hox-D11 [Frankliniella fusca]
MAKKLDYILHCNIFGTPQICMKSQVTLYCTTPSYGALLLGYVCKSIWVLFINASLSGVSRQFILTLGSGTFLARLTYFSASVPLTRAATGSNTLRFFWVEREQISWCLATRSGRKRRLQMGQPTSPSSWRGSILKILIVLWLRGPGQAGRARQAGPRLTLPCGSDDCDDWLALDEELPALPLSALASRSPNLSSTVGKLSIHVRKFVISSGHVQNCPYRKVHKHQVGKSSVQGNSEVNINHKTPGMTAHQVVVVPAVVGYRRCPPAALRPRHRGPGPGPGPPHGRAALGDGIIRVTGRSGVGALGEVVAPGSSVHYPDPTRPDPTRPYPAELPGADWRVKSLRDTR